MNQRLASNVLVSRAVVRNRYGKRRPETSLKQQALVTDSVDKKYSVMRFPVEVNTNDAHRILTSFLAITGYKCWKDRLSVLESQLTKQPLLRGSQPTASD